MRRKPKRKKLGVNGIVFPFRTLTFMAASLTICMYRPTEGGVGGEAAANPTKPTSSRLIPFYFPYPTTTPTMPSSKKKTKTTAPYKTETVGCRSTAPGQRVGGELVFPLQLRRSGQPEHLRASRTPSSLPMPYKALKTLNLALSLRPYSSKIGSNSQPTLSPSAAAT